jgi:hypothetical protein
MKTYGVVEAQRYSFLTSAHSGIMENSLSRKYVINIDPKERETWHVHKNV